MKRIYLLAQRDDFKFILKYLCYLFDSMLFVSLPFVTFIALPTVSIDLLEAFSLGKKTLKLIDSATSGLYESVMR